MDKKKGVEMKLNSKPQPILTHEGSKAKHISPELQLRRSVMSCMLWENEFYEDGQSIAERIKNTIPIVSPRKVADIAVEARNKMKLRHVPLLVAREMARLPEHKKYVAEVLYEIIQRPDELTEFLAIYWKDGKQPLSKQVRLGLAKAFTKFSAYSLAKYNRDEDIKLRDVLFLCHAKPKDKEQAETWQQLVDGKLPIPDTWEVSLSTGKDKRETFERLLKERKLGALALLRNLRNMREANVNEDLIETALESMEVEKVLPFRFISAARYNPSLEEEIEKVMMKCLSSQEKIKGHTVLLLDVSGSMDEKISDKSDITRMDAGCGVGILLREICEKIDIYTFSKKLICIPPRHGFALKEAIVRSQEHSGTPLGTAIKCIYSNRSFDPKTARIQTYFGGQVEQAIEYRGQDLHPDRLIIITDEQSCDVIPDPEGRAYMINVGSNKNGVGYGSYHHIDGWSEAVIDYIREFEREVICL